MSIEENKAIVRHFFEEGPSKGNLGAVNELISSDFVMHSPLPTEPGAKGIDDIITTCRAAFDNLNVQIDDMIAEGDKVTCRFTAHGVHRGQFMTLPPTGKEITMTGIEIFRLENGKVAELWAEANLIGLMQQLGVIPAFNQ